MPQVLALPSSIYRQRGANRNRRGHRSPKPIRVYDEGRRPKEGNGEDEVAALLEMLGLEWWYECWKYHDIVPDFWLPQVRGRELLIEVTDSAHEWGCNKQGRLSRLERHFRVPVLFINSYALQRLRRNDGVQVLQYCIDRVVFKPETKYGEIYSPCDILQPVMQAA